MIVIQDLDKNNIAIATTVTKALRMIGIHKKPSNWLYRRLREEGNTTPFKWKQYLVSKW